MKKFVIFPVLFLILPIVSAVCIKPDENMRIKENTVFCSGVYYIEKGLNIVASGITVDCDSSVFVGEGIGYGFLLRDVKNAVLQNCNISNFEIGVYLENANNSLIKDNYLIRNKFGIASFNSLNNNVNDNIFIDNINSNQVFYLATPILQQEPIREQEKELPATPQQAIGEVISIKKPFLEQDEIFAEVNSIFDKYFDTTQENLEITRTIFYDETDKSTKIILHLKPKKVLLNLSIYEKIPKCVSNYVNEILFKTGGYEVIKDDPLILWYFAKLDNDKELSYKVFKSIDEECKKLLLAFGIATGFEDFEKKKGEKSKANYLLVLSIGILIIVTIYFVLVKRRK